LYYLLSIIGMMLTNAWKKSILPCHKIYWFVRCYLTLNIIFEYVCNQENQRLTFCIFTWLEIVLPHQWIIFYVAIDAKNTTEPLLTIIDTFGIQLCLSWRILNNLIMINHFHLTYLSQPKFLLKCLIFWWWYVFKIFLIVVLSYFLYYMYISRKISYQANGLNLRFVEVTPCWTTT